MRNMLRGTTAIAAFLAATSQVSALTWTYNGGTAANNRWETTTSWDTTPLFDGTEDGVFNTAVINANRTLTLNGDRALNSLSFAASTTSAFRYTITPGSPTGIIQLTTGNLTIDGGGRDSGRPAVLTGTTIQVGTSPTVPVTNAVWDFKNSHATKSSFEMGGFSGIAGTVVSLIGNNGSVWAGDSSNFIGELRIGQNHELTSGGIKLELSTNNALGGVGSLVVANSLDNGAGITNFHITNTNQGLAAGSVVTTTHAMSIRADAKIAIAVGVFGDATRAYVARINGNLTGTGGLDVGYLESIGTSGFPNGTVLVAGSANTLSGNVAVRVGSKLQVDGVWTGGGNFTVTRGLLSGGGSIGLAEGKKIDLSPDNNTLPASLAPGTNGAVGTLTIGSGSTNSVNFNSAATGRQTQFLVDIGGDAADRLTIDGNLTIGAANTYLVFNQLSELTSDSYVLASWTGTLTGAFANVVNLPAGSSLVYESNQLVLAVPEPAMASVILLTAGALLSRRRDHSKMPA